MRLCLFNLLVSSSGFMWMARAESTVRHKVVHSNARFILRLYPGHISRDDVVPVGWVMSAPSGAPHH